MTPKHQLKEKSIYSDPFDLDDEVKNYLSERASAKGIGLGEMVNDLLKKDIALIEGVK